MSMNSKVSPVLRSQIMNTLSVEGIKMSNAVIEFRLNFSYSLRKIQEATQKMTAEGTLTATREAGKMFYRVTNPGATNQAAQGATASN